MQSELCRDRGGGEETAVECRDVLLGHVGHLDPEPWVDRKSGRCMTCVNQRKKLAAIAQADTSSEGSSKLQVRGQCRQVWLQLQVDLVPLDHKAAIPFGTIPQPDPDSTLADTGQWIDAFVV